MSDKDQAPGMSGWLKGVAGPSPYSSGDAAPATPAPPGAIDCHHHIFDRRFHSPGQVEAPDATLDDYRKFQRRLGISRSVFVASSNYGDDFRVILDSLARTGTETMRAVVLVNPDVEFGTLQPLHAAGVRGIRLYFGKNNIPDKNAFGRIAVMAADLGWSVNMVGSRDREVLLEWESDIAQAPCPIVIDHMGWSPQPASLNSDTAQMIRRLLATGNVYAKLSGPYLSSVSGAPDFVDVDELAATFASDAPERVIWGSDWPHPVAMMNRIRSMPRGCSIS